MTTTSLVDKGCFISTLIQQLIPLELTEIPTMTLIAKLLNISPTPMRRQLKKAAIA